MGDSRLGLVLEGRYRLEERLASGGTGIVYRATQLGLGRSVAIKFLHRSVVQSEVHRGRFKREATVMSRLRHPNIAAVIDSGAHDDIPYLVMELCEGTPLRQVINEGPLNLRRAIRIANQVLVALASAHEAGVVHRDLKPGNILLDQSVGTDHVKILDFGVAKLVTADGPTELSVAAGQPLGTPQYMSPEQAKAERVDHRTDLYAVGIILYEMTTGKRPFEAGIGFAILRQQVEDEARLPRDLAPMSKALQAVIVTAMEKDPDQRFQNAGEMAAALGEVPEATPGKRRRGGLVKWAWVSLVLLAAVAGSAWFAWYQGLLELPWQTSSVGQLDGVDDAGATGDPGSSAIDAASSPTSAPPSPRPAPWNPPSATIELGALPTLPITDTAKLRGTLGDKPFRPVFARLRGTASPGGFELVFAEKVLSGNPCRFSAGGERRIWIAVSRKPEGGQTYRAGNVSAQLDAESAPVLSDGGRLKLVLDTVDSESRVASGSVRLSDKTAKLGGDFRAVYCPSPRDDGTAKPTVNGVEWNPDRAPDPERLSAQELAGAWGDVEFRPSHANLTVGSSPDRVVLSFFASAPLDPCAEIGAGEAGLWIGLVPEQLSEGFAVTALLGRQTPSELPRLPWATVQYGGVDRSSLDEDATVLSLYIDSIDRGEVRGRVYAAAQGPRRAVATGAFRAIDCRDR